MENIKVNFTGEWLAGQSEYRQRDGESAVKLAGEVAGLGAEGVEVSYSDENASYFPITFNYKGVNFTINKGWKDEFNVHMTVHKGYDNLSSNTRGDVYKEVFVSNKVKVLTLKKLHVMCDEEMEFYKRLEVINNVAKAKHEQFLAEIATYGDMVHYHKNQNQGAHKVTGGYMEKNGIQFSFELCNDGYISKKIELRTHTNDLKTFDELSDNKYAI